MNPRKRQHFLIPESLDNKIACVEASLTEPRQQTGRTAGAASPCLLQHRRNLLRHFRRDDLEQAQARLSRALPAVRNLFERMSSPGTSALDEAHSVVSDIMTSGENVGAIAALAKLKKADEASFMHSLSVSALMIAFGRALEVSESVIHELAVGGLVHDIGKIAIPLPILRKTGKLTGGEMAVIQTHPVHGFKMLKRLGGVGQEILDIALFHHEKFDGTGYPVRLVGREIPFHARLAAVCDVYDALTSLRPYKPALSQTEALAIMRSSTGHFDPDLLQAFICRLIEPGVVM
jgi:HD-GYP domain-containing protein (c-di-GMP phosphodiesterase class II)